MGADVAAAAAIESRVFSDPWTARSLDALLGGPASRALAAVEADDTLIGYAMGRVVAGEAEILNLAVVEARRRRGVARALLARLLAVFRADGVGPVFLEVRRSNAAAIGLYEAAGFTVIGVRRGYYSSPVEDGLMLRLDLDPARRGNDANPSDFG